MADQVPAARRSSGVEALIARLRDDGVAAGRAEAERIVAEAEARARRLLDAAEAEAAAKIEAARKAAEAQRRAGEDALRAAARDTILEFKERLTRRLADDVSKTVAGAMRDEELLKRMILEVASRTRDEATVGGAGSVEIVLPRDVVGLDDLRRRPEELREGSLTHFVAAAAGDMLRDGVTFARAEDDAGGIRLRLGEQGITVDMTEASVAAVILSHLQPRFRALLEGVVR
jgi:V/A-type H+-transporting ATPase subunit E